MTAPIEDLSSLPGKKVSDQQGTSIGEVKEIYAMDGDGQPMWVAVEGSFGGDKRTVLVPIARLKEEDGEVGVPYSKDRIGEAPDVDISDGVSEEADRELRGYYGIGTGDQELRGDNKSYATLVPDEPGEAKVVDDANELEMPDHDKRTEETEERLQDSQRRDSRDVGDLTGEGDDSSEAEDKGEAEGEDEDEDASAKAQSEDEDSDTEDEDKAGAQGEREESRS